MKVSGQNNIYLFFWSTVYRQISTAHLYYAMYLRIYEMMGSVLP